MSAVRALGVAAVLLALVLVGVLSLLLVSFSYMQTEDPDERRFFEYVRHGTLWTGLPIVGGTLLAGGGLMAHRAWARPLMFALVPWHILTGIGLPVAAASLIVLTRDQADVLS